MKKESKTTDKKHYTNPTEFGSAESIKRMKEHMVEKHCTNVCACGHKKGSHSTSPKNGNEKYFYHCFIKNCKCKRFKPKELSEDGE